MTRERWDGRPVILHYTRTVQSWERPCGALSSAGLQCTRLAGHDGWHRHWSKADVGMPPRDEWWP